MEIVDGKQEVVVEVRGEGSYAIIPPSVGYSEVRGDLLQLPQITDETYQRILDTFKPFNSIKNFEEDSIVKTFKFENTNTPWDWFQDNVSWEEVLVPFGWTRFGENRWTRPNKKERGLSATTNYNGLPIFYCFSSNAHPFEAYSAYSKFQVYAMLNYGGDIKLAVKSLDEKYPNYKPTVLKDYTEKRKSDLRIITWGEFNKMELPKAIWWVKGLIPQKGFVIIASVSGDGKSWNAYEFANCIVSGKNFLGQEQFETTQGNVLYIDAENPPIVMQQRGRKISLHSDIKFLQSYDFSLNTDEGANQLIEIIKENNIDVVFVDTFRALGGGINEDRAEEIRMFYNRFKKIRDEQTTFVFLDHHRKTNSFEGKTPSKESLLGSQDKTAGVDVLLMLKKDGNEISFYQRKNRFEPEIKPFKVKMEDVMDEKGEKFVTFSYLGEITKDELKKDAGKEAVLEILQNGEKSREELVRLSKALYDVGSKNVGNALKDLIKNGDIYRREDGKKDVYFLRLMPFAVVPEPTS
jgi:hypothetical protein